MARIDFGKTWWGTEWVRAMERIDRDQNRLPRGRRYARNGSVQAIEIKKGEIESRVKGSRPSPYRQSIRLAHFSKESATTLRDIIHDHPAIEAELDLGRMPQELKGLLEQNGLSLFPSRWDEIEARCSCPDWANPCKHLAAVYYLIAREIDRDPFVLFSLRGVDPEALRHHRRAESTKTPSRKKSPQPGDMAAMATPYAAEPFVSDAEIKRLITGRAVPRKERGPSDSLPPAASGAPPGGTEFAPSFDFEPIDSTALFELLAERPVFFDNGDFRSHFRKIHTASLRRLEDLTVRDDASALRGMNLQFIFPEDAFRDPGVFLTASGDGSDAGQGALNRGVQSLFPHSKPRSMKLKHPVFQKGGNFHRGETEGFLISFSDFLEAAIELPRLRREDGIGEGLAHFSLLSGFALGLLRSRSFTPGVDIRADGEFRIHYIPNIHSGPIAKNLRLLEEMIPPALAFRANDGRCLHPDGTRALLSRILGGYFRVLASHSPHVRAGDKIVHAFFAPDSVFVPESFGERSVGKSVADWLESLSTLGSNFSPVIRIEKKTANTFTLHIDVENRRDSLFAPIPLETLFVDKSNPFAGSPATSLDDVRRRILRQMLLAGERIPVLRQILDDRGTRFPEIGLKELAVYLGEHARFFRMLGIRYVLPKELRDLIRPTPCLSAASEKKIVSRLSLDQMLSFEPAVALGDETISAKEFKKLVRGAQGIVEYRGRYILIEPGDAERLSKRLDEPPVKMGGMNLLRSVLSGEFKGRQIRINRDLAAFFERLQRVDDVHPPEGLKAKLRPYQKRGFSWLYSNYDKGLGSCLADDMGLGKTLQAVAFLLKLKEEKKLQKPALVVAPLTLLENWKKEIGKFAPSLSAHIYHGQGRTLALKGIDIVLTTYGTLLNDADYFRKKQWSVQIIDEAQAIKNRFSSRAKSTKTIRAGGYVALSGTPVENHTGELWSIFDYVNPGLLGDATSFRREFAVPIERYRSEEAVARLHAITGPFLMRRLKTDRTVIADLPEKIVHNEYCRLSKRQAALYKQTLNDIMDRIENSEGINRRGLVFKLMTALKQICNHPAQMIGRGEPDPAESGKLNRVIELVERILSAGEKVLIFTQYRKMADLLERALGNAAGEPCIVFSGEASRKKREGFVERFQTDPSRRIMIVTLQSGGVGLNLTAANHVIHYDLWWNPAVENQATDRAFRIGQTKNVEVHRLVTSGTFEEKIDEMIQSKSALASLTVNAGEKWISELSNGELRNVFELVEAGE